MSWPAALTHLQLVEAGFINTSAAGGVYSVNCVKFSTELLIRQQETTDFWREKEISSVINTCAYIVKKQKQKT